MIRKDQPYRFAIRDICEHSLKDAKWLDVDYILAQDDPWAYFMMLLPQRSNIIDFIPIEESDRVLLLGTDSDCVITSLRDRCSELICLEEDFVTYRMAKIRISNVKIYCKRFEDIIKSDKFDKVFWIGGSEFYKGRLNDILLAIYNVLKDNGRLYFACHNSFGIRNLSGINDSSQAFSGLEGTGYPGFSKATIVSCLTNNGFSDIRFMYPYPDHLFTFEVFTDDFLPTADIIGVDRYKHTISRLSVFDDDKAILNIIDQGMFGELCNSFFVEASAGCR